MAQATKTADSLLEHLAREHWTRLYRIAFHVVRDVGRAEEAVQESFVKALRILEAADPGAKPPWAPHGCAEDDGERGAGGGDDRSDEAARGALSWMATVVRNTAIDAYRQVQRSRGALGALRARASRSPGDAPGIAVDLADALAGLPAPQELVVQLHAVEGLSFREIATLLDEKESAVSMRFYRARERLRGVLGDGGDEGAGG